MREIGIREIGIICLGLFLVVSLGLALAIGLQACCTPVTKSPAREAFSDGLTFRAAHAWCREHWEAKRYEPVPADASWPIRQGSAWCLTTHTPGR